MFLKKSVYCIKSLRQQVIASFFRFVVANFVFWSAACSPGMFSGVGQDNDVAQMTHYRRVNTACAGMNLENNQIDVPTFRAILKCFNTYHALDPLDDLFNGPDGLKDHEIQPIVSHLNRSILDDKKRLFEIESTYNSLVSQGILEESLGQVGELLKNEDFIASSIALLEEGFFSSVPGSSENALMPDQELLQSLEEIGQVLTPQRIREAIELGILISESPAFQELLDAFKMPSRHGMSTSDLVKEFYKYLQETHFYSCKEGNTLVRRDIKADLFEYFLHPAEDHLPFKLLDRVIGSDSADIRVRIPKLAALLSEILKDQNQKFDGSPGSQSSLFRDALHAFNILKSPVHCMIGGASVPSGTRHLISQLAGQSSSAAPEYIFRTGRLDLMALGPFCTYPTQSPDQPKTEPKEKPKANFGSNAVTTFNDRYQTLVELSKIGITTGSNSIDLKPESAMVTMAELLKTLHEPQLPWKGCDQKKASHPGETYHPLTTFFSNIMGDGVPGQGEGLSHIIPVLVDFADRYNRKDPALGRNVFANILLVLSSIDEPGRAMLSDAFRFLALPRNSLNHKNILDIFLQAVSRHSLTHMIGLVESLGKYVDVSEPVLGPALRTLRKAYYVNQVHPILDLVQKTLKESTQNGNFYGSLFLVSQNPKFKESIRLIASMSKKEDGRLNSLLGSLISLFHKFALQGSVPVLRDETPEFPRVPRNTLTQKKLTPVAIARNAISPEVDFNVPVECLQMNLDLSIASGNDYLSQLNLFLKCQGDQNLEQAVEVLRKSQKEGGGSFFDYGVELVSDLTAGSFQSKLGLENINYLMKEFSTASSFNQLTHFLNFGKLFISPPRLPILGPFFEVTTSIYDHSREELQKTQSFIADQIEMPSFPILMAKTDDLFQEAKKIVDKRSDFRKVDLKNRDALDRKLEILNPDLRNKIRSAVDQFECDVPEQDREARVDQIIRDSKEDLTANELVDDPVKGISSLQSWEFNSLNPFLDLVIHKITDPAQSEPQRKLLEGFKNVFKRFTKKSHVDPRAFIGDAQVRPFYTPEYFAQWLYKLSTDFQPIVIFPHGCLEIIQDPRGGATCKKGRYYVSPKPKVVLYNSLKRLERVLYEVSFPGPIPPHRDLGQDFPQELAEAWGDMSPENWPTEISSNSRIRRAHGRPLNLEEAVEDIIDRQNSTLGLPTENLNWLTWAVGFPLKPQCPGLREGSSGVSFGKQGAWPNGSLEWMMGIISSFSTVPGTDVAAFKARVFNLNQVVDVLRENAKRPKDADGHDLKDKNGDIVPAGLEVLRDMFFEIYYSTPASVRQSANPSSGGVSNNLTLVPLVVRLGVLTQLGRFVQYFDENDPDLNRLFVSLFLYATSDEPTRLMSDVFNADQNPSPGVSSPALSGLKILETAHRDLATKTAWNHFKFALDDLFDSPEYKSMTEGDSTRILLNFLEERGSADPVSKATAQRLRFYLGRRLRGAPNVSSSLEQFLYFAKIDRPGLERSLQTMGNYIGDGQEGRLKKFLEMVKQSLNEPQY